MRQAHQNLYVLFEPVINVLGCELVGIEYLPQGKSSILRIYIDKEDGITLDDCSQVSHQISGLLDVENPIKESYTLEVSSPGLDRLLFKKEHFERFKGSRVKFSLRMPRDGRRNFKGVIVSCRDSDVLIDVDGEQLSFSWENIDKARLIPEM